MSALRCPACRNMTASAFDGGYHCDVCARDFPAGLVRVPRAWGAGGDPMASAAALELPYPEVAVVERDRLEEQSTTLAASLPARPLVLGGCCCTHVGAIRGLAARGGRLAVVWLDAHGDLNTPETSPSGDLWGMALRMALDEGAIDADDVALVGSRNLDPGEVDFLAATGIDDSLDRALAHADAVYVALDVDVLEPGEIAMFFPEPEGLSIADAEFVLSEVVDRSPLAGIGVTGLVPADSNVRVVGQLLAAAGL